MWNLMGFVEVGHLAIIFDLTTLSTAAGLHERGTMSRTWKRGTMSPIVAQRWVPGEA